MNHYCTYFDQGFLLEGLALWQSLRRHDPDSQLWVLALEEATHTALEGLQDDRLHAVPLSRLEADDPALAVAKTNRSRVEYYFTLSPCWPLWLLQQEPQLTAVTYLDADLFFFANPREWFAEIEAAGASVGITAHRYPPELCALEKWGRYNVGIQYFRRDETALAVLADWRQRCLDWCYDRLEGDRFADQKYLEAWSARFGRAVHVVNHSGINAAPWNWSGCRWGVEPDGVRVDERPLILFHFAKFRALGAGLWDSGQVEFSVMPRWLRVCIYEPYVRSLDTVAVGLSGSTGRRVIRGVRPGFKKWFLGLMFGSFWWRAGGVWLALGLGPLGRYSGALLARYRRRQAP